MHSAFKKKMIAVAKYGPAPEPTAPAAAGTFTPAPRGNITAAIASGQVEHLKPESPRPVEMLDGIRIVSSDILTAADCALYELLVSTAFASDPTLSAEENVLPSFIARDFLGGIRRPQVEAAMDRLRKTVVEFDVYENGVRRWGRVPLLIGWLTSDGDEEDRDVLHYTLPLPVRQLMNQPERYRYIELAVLAKMQSKYGIRLYKKLLVRATSGLDNLMEFDASPAEVADWLDYRPSQWHGGQFKTRVLEPALEDLKLSKKFEVEIAEVHGRRRGSPVVRYRFKITPKARSYFTMPTLRVDKEILAAYKHRDHPTLQVSPKIWLRAETLYRDTVVRDGWVRADGPTLAKAWLHALDEALSDPTLVIEGREYRGAKLLAAIKAEGADQSAWSLADEEVRKPDLILKVRDLVRSEVHVHDRRIARASQPSESPVAALPAPTPVVEEIPASNDNADEPQVDPVADQVEVARVLLRRLVGTAGTGQRAAIAREPVANVLAEVVEATADLDRKMKGLLGRSLATPLSMHTEYLVREIAQHALRIVVDPATDDAELLASIDELLTSDI